MSSPKQQRRKPAETRSGLLLENRWQARKVRWISLGSLVWSAGLVYWAIELAQTFGLSSGDGGVLRPAEQRYAVATVTAAAGIAPLIGMIVYSRLYLTRIVREPETLELTVLGFLMPFRLRVPISDLEGNSEYEGRMSGRVSVNAPWLALRVRDRRIPFIIDLQAEQVNKSAIAGLMTRRKTKD